MHAAAQNAGLPLIVEFGTGQARFHNYDGRVPEGPVAPVMAFAVEEEECHFSSI